MAASEDLPVLPPEADWLQALRRASAASSQAKVAQQLGVSTTAVSQVLNGRYPASTDRIEQRVRGALMNEKVRCPVGGLITKQRCQQAQERLKPGMPLNEVSTRLKRACPKCPHSRKPS